MTEEGFEIERLGQSCGRKKEKLGWWFLLFRRVTLGIHFDKTQSLELKDNPENGKLTPNDHTITQSHSHTVTEG